MKDISKSFEFSKGIFERGFRRFLKICRFLRKSRNPHFAKILFFSGKTKSFEIKNHGSLPFFQSQKKSIYFKLPNLITRYEFPYFIIHKPTQFAILTVRITSVDFFINDKFPVSWHFGMKYGVTEIFKISVPWLKFYQNTESAILQFFFQIQKLPLE